MTAKHEIEIEGLPEGWRAVAYRSPIENIDHILSEENEVILCDWDTDTLWLIVEKIKPRRIVLELTEGELSLLRSIPVEQRLLKNPAMLDLITKIQNLDKVKDCRMRW